METLLPEFETISLIHPTCLNTTSHLLEQRQFLSTQPLVFEFEGVDDDDSLDDQELNFYHNANRRYSSEFIFRPSNMEYSTFNPSLNPQPQNENENNNQINNDQINNNNNNINNNNNNINNNNNNINNNNINNCPIENIRNHLGKLEREGKIKIPKVKKTLNNNICKSNFKLKKKSFLSEKKIISISKTMKKNVLCLIKI
ncbi:hypothetical protein ACTFIY_005839 [Dictyostelium cf. discoideum]